MSRRVLLMISSMRGGGSEQQTLLLLRHLDRKRFTPHLYVLERKGELFREIPDDVAVHAFDDLQHQPAFYFPGRVLQQQVQHLRQLLLAKSIDVVYDRTFHMTMIAGAACRRSMTPRVSTIVSPPDRALPLVERRFVSLKRRRLAKSYRESSQVLAVSKVAAESAESYYALSAGSVDVVPNPVDLEAMAKHRRDKPTLSNSSLNVVCVGRMTNEKGHQDLLTAITIAQENWTPLLPLRVVMVGDGPLRDALQVQAGQVKPPHSIEFVGAQPEAASIISEADALVLPSHFEGMPNVVLEAMAMGVPVIATRAGGTVELQKDEPTILWADPQDPHSLAEALKSFAENPDSAVRRITAAQKLVASHHDIRKTTRKIEGYLEVACQRT
ncbi:MAG: glycosyltransferase [Rubripirellula sp.]